MESVGCGPAVLPRARGTLVPVRCPRGPSPSGAISPALLAPQRLQGRRTQREGQGLGSVRDDGTALRRLRRAGRKRAGAGALPLNELGGTGAAALLFFPGAAATGFPAGPPAVQQQTKCRLRPTLRCTEQGRGDREGGRCARVRVGAHLARAATIFHHNTGFNRAATGAHGDGLTDDGADVVLRTERSLFQEHVAFPGARPNTGHSEFASADNVPKKERRIIISQLDLLVHMRTPR